MRSEALKLYEFLANLPAEGLFIVHWESFFSLWPVFDWAVFLMRHAFHQLKLGIDCLMQPSCNLLFQRMITEFTVHGAVRGMEERDIDFLFRKLAVYFDIQVEKMVTYELPGKDICFSLHSVIILWYPDKFPQAILPPVPPRPKTDFSVSTSLPVDLPQAE